MSSCTTEDAVTVDDLVAAVRDWAERPNAATPLFAVEDRSKALGLDPDRLMARVRRLRRVATPIDQAAWTAVAEQQDGGRE